MKHILIAKRLSEIMRLRGLNATKLSLSAHVSRASISQYINGSHKPSPESSQRLGAVLRVDPLWLMGFSVPMNPDEDILYIPVYSTFPTEGAFPIDYLLSSVSAGHAPSCFGITAPDDAMCPSIRAGDLLIIQPNISLAGGDLAAIRINHSEELIRIWRKGKRTTFLSAAQPSIPDLDLSDVESVEIIGKVVEIRRRL